MVFDWQTWCALGVVAFSFAFLLSRLWALASGRSNGGCSACPNKSAPPLMKTLPLVQMGTIQPSKKSNPSASPSMPAKASSQPARVCDRFGIKPKDAD